MENPEVQLIGQIVEALDRKGVGAKWGVEIAVAIRSAAEPIADLVAEDPEVGKASVLRACDYVVTMAEDRLKREEEVKARRASSSEAEAASS